MYIFSGYEKAKEYLYPLGITTSPVYISELPTRKSSSNKSDLIYKGNFIGYMMTPLELLPDEQWVIYIGFGERNNLPEELIYEIFGNTSIQPNWTYKLPSSEYYGYYRIGVSKIYKDNLVKHYVEATGPGDTLHITSAGDVSLDRLSNNNLILNVNYANLASNLKVYFLSEEWWKNGSDLPNPIKDVAFKLSGAVTGEGKLDNGVVDINSKFNNFDLALTGAVVGTAVLKDDKYTIDTKISGYDADNNDIELTGPVIGNAVYDPDTSKATIETVIKDLSVALTGYVKGSASIDSDKNVITIKTSKVEDGEESSVDFDNLNTITFNNSKVEENPFYPSMGMSHLYLPNDIYILNNDVNSLYFKIVELNSKDYSDPDPESTEDLKQHIHIATDTFSDSVIGVAVPSSFIEFRRNEYEMDGDYYRTDYIPVVSSGIVKVLAHPADISISKVGDEVCVADDTGYARNLKVLNSTAMNINRNIVIVGSILNINLETGMFDILLNVRKSKLSLPQNILNALFYNSSSASGSNPFVTLEDIKNTKSLQQLDLMVPGKFAKEVSDTLLESAGDISYWMLGKGLLKSFSVQCLVADSGAEPALVSLVVNGVKVYALEVKSSILNTYEFITPEDTYIETGDRIELSLDYTGTNADSENLRAFIVVETGY